MTRRGRGDAKTAVLGQSGIDFHSFGGSELKEGAKGSLACQSDSLTPCPRQGRGKKIQRKQTRESPGLTVLIWAGGDTQNNTIHTGRDRGEEEREG